MRVVDLTKPVARARADELLAISRDVSDWTVANLLHDLPGKWTLSFLVEVPEPAGYAILSRRGEGWIHLNQFMVAPAHRGTGLGGRMIDEVKRRAGEAELTLKVGRDNARAHRFYLGHGFVFTDRSGDHWWMALARRA